MGLLVQTSLLRLAQRVDPTTKSGQYFQDLNSLVAIASSTNATPIKIVTATNHGLVTGNQVFISGHLVNTAVNNTPSNPNWTITKVDATSFTLNNSVGIGVGGATGNVFPGLIGTIPGAAFPAQLLLDRYNDARLILASFLKQKLSYNAFVLATSGNLVNTLTLTFSSGIAVKPAGFIEGVSLYDASYNRIEIIPANQLEAARGLESATNRFVIDSGSTLSAITGNTNVLDGSSYNLWYYAIPIYLLTDITGGAVSESFNDKFFPIIIEIGEKLCNEVGSMEINAFLNSMFGGK